MIEPEIKVTFCYSGKVGKFVNLGDITKSLDLSPSKTRNLEQWPDAIKYPKSPLPEGVGTQFTWDLSTGYESCRAVEWRFNELLLQFRGKEQIINELTRKYDLSIGFVVTIKGLAANLPEMSLTNEIVSFAASINGSISFDMYVD